MEIHKQFSFIGNLKKLHEDDNQPIENFSANIQCHKNGNIFLEIDSITNERLNNKKFFERTPRYQLNVSQKIADKKITDPFIILNLDESEKELVQSLYEGDYVIEGQTSEGWLIKAEIVDYGFSICFNQEARQEESNDTTQKYLARLKNLSIDYHPNCQKTRIIESIYGIANLDLFQSFSTEFLDSKYKLSLINHASINTKSPETLTAEITIQAIDEDKSEVICYDTYFAWFELLISFATGKCLKDIYKIETSKSGSKRKKVEFWSGSQTFMNGSGITIIQAVFLHLFIQQCASKVTSDYFSSKGLGSALRWYTEAFTSSTASVNFLLLCTVLETLNKHHSSKSSSRLISKTLYKEIRDKIFKTLNEYEQKLGNEENVSKYRIFKAKVEKSFGDGSFNRIGSLRTSLKQMLEFYKTPYTDLFPNLEFIKIRDDIVHKGFGGDDIFPSYYKLINLIVRLILSILEYQGDYIEYRRVEVGDFTNFHKYSLAYKTFPFEDEQ
jgi:hypothetical protein